MSTVRIRSPAFRRPVPNGAGRCHWWTSCCAEKTCLSTGRSARCCVPLRHSTDRATQRRSRTVSYGAWFGASFSGPTGLTPGGGGWFASISRLLERLHMTSVELWTLRGQGQPALYDSMKAATSKKFRDPKGAARSADGSPALYSPM